MFYEVTANRPLFYVLQLLIEEKENVHLLAQITRRGNHAESFLIVLGEGLRMIFTPRCRTVQTKVLLKYVTHPIIQHLCHKV